MTMLLKLLLLVHVLALVGLFGSLLMVQFLPAEVRRSAEVLKRSSLLLNLLLGVGLVAGLARYLMMGGPHLGAHFNGVIGTKFAILLAVGALIPLSKREGLGDLLRRIAINLLVVAALLGMMSLSR